MTDGAIGKNRKNKGKTERERARYVLFSSYPNLLDKQIKHEIFKMTACIL